RVADQFRRIDRRGINRNLVRALSENGAEIIHCSYAAAYGKRNKYAFSYFTYHVDDRASVVGRSRYIEKYKFICPRLIICFRDLHRISGIFQIHEINAFYYSSPVHIETGDDPLCKHNVSSYSSTKFFSIRNPTSLLFSG